jgi:hypothetical protein
MIFLAAVAAIVIFVIVSYHRLVSLAQRAPSASFASNLVAGLVLALLTALAAPASAQGRSFAIDRFAVTLEVTADGILNVREAITFDFKGSHQGIFRTIPVRYERRGFEFALRIDRVHAFDERVTPLRTEVSRLGRAIHVKVSVPGAVNTTRTIILTYRARRALMEVDGHDELYWNVTGSEWDVPIRQAEAVVSSPASVPLDQIQAIAYTGPAATAGADYTEDRADTYLTFRTTRPLRAREGLTVAVGWPPGAIRGPSAARRALWWLGDNWPFALPLLTIAGALIVWQVHERHPGGARTIKPEYAPPEGLGPAAGGALVTERAEPRDVVATLVDLAVRGLSASRRSGPTSAKRISSFTGSSRFRAIPPSRRSSSTC